MKETELIDRQLYLDVVNEKTGSDIPFDTFDDFFDKQKILKVMSITDEIKPIAISNKDKSVTSSFDDQQLEEAVKAKSAILISKKDLCIENEIIHKNILEVKANMAVVNNIIELITEIDKTVRTNDGKVVYENFCTSLYDGSSFKGSTHEMIRTLNWILNYFKIENTI